MSALATISDIQRDRWGRPLITPPGGDKPIAYTRVTTLAKTLEEQSALAAWKQRMTLIGVTVAPHIALAAAAARDDKAKLNDLAEQALTAAQAGAKAEIGTALHKLCERLDLGEEVGPYPQEYAADIDAYRAATAGIKWLGVEQFIVLDDLLVAGTADRIGRLPDGRIVIADIKTGSIDYGGLSIAIQLACYANGVAYDVATGQRTPLDVDTETGVVVHLPSGSGTCTLHDVDLYAGWDAAVESVKVRDLRKMSRNWINRHAQVDPPDLAAAIASAVDTSALAALWRDHSARFTPHLEQLAAARHALLAAGAA